MIIFRAKTEIEKTFAENTRADDLDKIDQEKRGLRIKNIRENELHMNKTDFAKEIGISSQFLGLVENGKGNLVYKSIKKLRDLSGHSADYILYGLDDNNIDKTKKLLQDYSEQEIIETINFIKHFILLIRNI